MTITPPPIAAKQDPGAPTPATADVPNSLPGSRIAPALPLLFADDGSGTNITVRGDIAAPASPRNHTEIVDKRTEHSRTYANADGTYSVDVSIDRVNYKKADGTFEAIDTTLEPISGDATWDFTQKANDKRVVISKRNPENALAEVAAGPHIVDLRVVGATKGSTRSASNKVEFPGLATSDSVAVIPTADGFEFTATLASASSPAIYRFAMDTHGLVATLVPASQAIVLTDPAASDPTAIVGVVSAPLLVDAANTAAPPDTVQTSLSTTDKSLRKGEVLLTYAIDPTYLAAGSRAFPVTLDPSISVCTQAGSGSTCAQKSVAEYWVMGGKPSTAMPAGYSWDRVGTDKFDSLGYGQMITELWFQMPTLPDGAAVVNSTLSLQEGSNWGPAPSGTTKGQGFKAYLNSTDWKGGHSWFDSSGSWSTASYNDRPSYDSTIYAAGNACGGVWTTLCTVNMDADALVRAWLTHTPADWKQNFGVSLLLDNQANGEIFFANSGYGSTSGPKLTIWYAVTGATMAFDSKLGPDFAPTTMVANSSVNLPINFTNKADWTWTGCSTSASSDCFRLGYRWFDAQSKNVVPSGASGPWNLVDLPGLSLDPNETTTNPITVPVKTPGPGSYTLRFDVVRDYSGNKVWLSDWALGSKYYARAKVSSSPSNVHWGGTSVVEREEYGISVVSGTGSAGDVKSIDLPDGSKASINLWSKNLWVDGSGGNGFADVGQQVQLDYYYNSADRASYPGMLNASGWYSNFDERFEPGVSGTQYVYRDAVGNKYLVSRSADGQLVSSAPFRIDRPRVTVFDENVVVGTGSGYGWSQTGSPTFVQLPSGGGQGQAYTGTHVYEINSSLKVGTQAPLFLGPTNLPLDTKQAGISLRDYPNFSFAVQTNGAAGAAIGVRVEDRSLAKDANGNYPAEWIFYTVGTDFTLDSSSWFKEPLGGSVVNTWRTLGAGYVDILDDWANDYSAAHPGQGVNANDDLVATAFDFMGNGGTGKTWFDDVRFEGRNALLFGDQSITWTSNGGTNIVTETTTDVPSGSARAWKVVPTNLAGAPNCHTGTCKLGTYTYQSWAVSSLAYATWSWKKVGGNTIAVAFDVQSERSPKPSGTITYYAGPTPPPGADHPIQVSPTVPTTWTPVTRNLLEDARTALGFFNDDPKNPPIADDVDLLGFRIVAGDGKYALFAHGGIATLPSVGGQQYNKPTGDDFIVTMQGGVTHRFNSDGLLTSIQDRDGNATTLHWLYGSGYPTNYGSSATNTQAPYTLDYVAGASDGLPLSDGTTGAIRRLNVTQQSDPTKCKAYTIQSSVTGCVLFTEEFGHGTTVETGRITEFAHDGTGATHDLVAVAPARLNGNCDATAGNGSGCIQFGYIAGHWLQVIRDPRYPGNATAYTTIGYDNSTSPTQPMSVTNNGDNVTLLNVLSYDNAKGAPYPRVAWQDADNVATKTIQFADLNPNGSVYREYAPASCGSPCSATSAAGSIIALYEVDGLNHLSTETRYRSANAAGAIVARRGSYATFGIDNFADPLVGGQTAWSQTPEQYAASVAAGSPDRYRTFYTYNAWGDKTHEISPHLNDSATFTATMKNSAPLHWWRLDDTATPAKDSGSSVVTAAMTSVTTGQPGALVDDVDTAMGFNGTSSFLATATTTTPATSGTFTVEAWARLDPTADLSKPNSIVGSRTATDHEAFDMKFMKDANGTLLHGDIGTGTAWLTTTADVRLNVSTSTWYHIVYVVSPAGWAIYVNGAIVNAGGYTASGTPLLMNGTDPLRIGQAGFNGEWFDGTIDEVAVYNRVLTADEIRAHYAAGGQVATQDTQTVYDDLGHPVQVWDNFVRNPSFDSGLDNWAQTGTITYAAGTATIAAQSSLSQYVQLVPGQTFRFQCDLGITGGTPKATVEYVKANGALATTPLFTFDGSSQCAADVTLPFDTNGLAKVTLANSGSSGTISANSAAVFTTYKAYSYLTARGQGGLVSTMTDILGATGSNETVTTKYDYGATELYAPNLLTNGGFASGDTGWVIDTGASGQLVESFRMTDATWTLRDGDVDGYARGGKYGSTMAIHWLAGNTDGGGLHQDFTPGTSAAGRTYSVSALVANHRLTDAHLELQFLDASGAVLTRYADASTTRTGGADRSNWDYQTVTGIAPSGTVKVRVAAVGAAPSSAGSDGWLWVDQVRLVESAAAQPYVPDVSMTPPVFITRTTRNYQNNGLNRTNTTNVSDVAAFDRWGRQIVAIDADGVGSVTQYAPNQTDISSRSNGIGATTTSTYDEVGNVLTATDEAGNVTSTAYRFDNQIRDVTGPAPDKVVTHYDYDTVSGRQIAKWENYVLGGPNTTSQNVETAWAYDSWGRITDTYLDAKGANARTNKTYDLQGNATATTLYDGRDSTGRTTRTFFDSAGHGTGVQKPIAPASTDTSAPLCPNGGGARCSSVDTHDLDGLKIESIDALGVVTHSWFDLAGHEVRKIVNYKPSTTMTYTPDTNVVSETVYDTAARVQAASSYPIAASTTSLGIPNTTDTTYDPLGRVVQVVKPNSVWIQTIYTGADRVAMTSRPGTSNQQTSQVGWTRNVYDAAGRQTKTIVNADLSDIAGFQSADFEDGAALWTPGPYPSLLAAPASISVTGTRASSGSGSLKVTTAASGSNSGAAWSLTGTFVTGHVYRLHADVFSPAGLSIEGRFGLNGAVGSTITTNGSWAPLDISWTPSANVSSGVVFVARQVTATGATFYLDNVQAWDSTPGSTSLFDDGTRPGWSGDAVPGLLNVPPYMVTTGDGGPTYSGAGRLKVVTTASSAGGSGVTWALPGTFLPGHSYQVTAWLRADTGTQTVAASIGWAGDRPTSTITLTTTYQRFSTVWSPSTMYSSNDPFGVRFAVVSTTASPSSFTFYVDDVSVYDVTTAVGGASDLARITNVPDSVTVYDARSKVVKSIQAPGHPGEVAPVTVSTYDTSGRLTAVTTNAIAGVAATNDINMTSAYVYDRLDRKTDSTDPLGIKTHYDYDGLGDVTATTANYRTDLATPGPDTTHVNASVNVKATFAYDDLKELIASCTPERVREGCDPTSTVTTSLAYQSASHADYDRNGRIQKATPAVNTSAQKLVTTTYAYDNNDRQTATYLTPAGATDPVRRTTATYDKLGRPTQSTADTASGSGTSLTYTTAVRTTTAYDSIGRRIQLDSYTGTSSSPDDTLKLAYDVFGAVTSVDRAVGTTTPLTRITYNADGTISSRTDCPVSSTASTYEYDLLGHLLTATTPTVGNGPYASFRWRLDGVMDSRTWPNGIAGTFSYDGAKRVTGLVVKSGNTAMATLGRQYNARGDVMSESQSLAGLSGSAVGDGTQTFTYDELRRVLTSTLAIGTTTLDSKEYRYDADSNRVYTKDDGVATEYDFDRTGVLVAQKDVTSGNSASYTYDQFGNLTISAINAASSTSYSYDAMNRLVSITAPSAEKATFTFDALGHHKTRSTPTKVDTYAYVGLSDNVVQIKTAAPDGSGATTTNSGIDAIGDRFTVNGGTLKLLLPDLHGNVAATFEFMGTAVLDAFRYDAYGVTVGQYPTAGSKVPWRFQGRLLESLDGTRDLYDFDARSYDPYLGVFTSIDTAKGSAQNPITFNLYLYAQGNPAGMVDPDGHWPWDDVAKSVGDAVGGAANAVGGAVQTVTTTVVTTAVSTATTAAATAVAGALDATGGTLVTAAIGATVGAVTTAAGDICTGQGINLEHIASGAVSGATYAVVLEHTGNTTLADAASTAAGDLFTQGWDYVASGGKSGFDLGRTAYAVGETVLGDKIGDWAGNLWDRGRSSVQSRFNGERPEIDAPTVRPDSAPEAPLTETRRPTRDGTADDDYVPQCGDFCLSPYARSLYPAGFEPPTGVLRRLPRDEYAPALQMKNNANRSIHREEPELLKDMDVHEVVPVQYGGSPTDRANKIALPKPIHQEFTSFWRQVTYAMDEPFRPGWRNRVRAL